MRRADPHGTPLKLSGIAADDITMVWRAGRRRVARRATAVCAVIAALLATTPDAQAQSDGQQLLDQAIESLELRDDRAYRQAVEEIATSDQWFPSTLGQALDERDLDLIIMVWFVLDASDDDLLRTAMDMVSYERDGLRHGDLDSTLDREELERADRQGLTALETVERRGLPVTAEMRTALSLLPDPADGHPAAIVYDTAITQLAGVMAGTLTNDAPLDPDDTTNGNSAVNDATIEAEADDAQAASIAQIQMPTSTTVDTTPNGSDDAAPWIALGGISVAAVLLGLFALRRSHEAHGLAGLANTDGLTGLHNRRKFDADIEEHRGRGDAPIAMLMVDVDRFKDFNDRYGHATGDAVLRIVADALTHSIRKGDVAYRYGGEEFCALLPDTSPDDARFVAERIRATIEATALPVNASLTASVGLATGAASSLHALVMDADTALYAAKESGRNCTVSA